MGVERIVSRRALTCPSLRHLENMESPLLLKPELAASRRKKILLVAVPAIGEVLATGLGCIGMLEMPASVWQMVKGVILFFTGILSVLVLKRKLYLFHWIGLLLCITGVAAVGYASVENELGSKVATQYGSSVAFGVALTLLGQLFQAAQVVSEEYLLKDIDLTAVEIIGYEGLWGVLMMVVVVFPVLWLLPGRDHGHAEDMVDTFVLLANSRALLYVLAIQLVACGTLNIAGIAVTGAFSAVHRMMLDASRAILVWCFGLVVHYKVDADSPFGEKWTSSSKLQLGGFIMLLTGQAVYSEVICLPGWSSCPNPSANVSAAADHVMPGLLHQCSQSDAKRHSSLHRESKPQQISIITV